ncbi:Protein FAM92A [Eumeta japonica]|uniref:Protein FAM92A n=1 Tax=Eumeta variegata TaxID=151549 RepID=A0A4C1SVR5_EUMVA|nr:Protein FAM92A [Eumeta japonica]
MFRNESLQTYEQQAKFIQDRISSVEKNFAELCSVFGDYARKTARLRDKGDELSNVLKVYADNEHVNKSLSTGLENLSITLTALEEYRNCEVQRIEAKVIGELSQYETICKHAREEVKHTMTVRDKELSRKKVLDKARERQPYNRQQISYAETELLKASAEMSRTAKSLSEQTEFFERRKLQQLKSLLANFITIEMTFHAKAVELLTIAFQQVNEINDKSDLEPGETVNSDLNYQQLMRLKQEVEKKRPEYINRKEKQENSGISARTSSLGSLLNQGSPGSTKENESTDSEVSEEEGSSETDSK